MNFNLKKQSSIDQVPFLIGVMFRVPNVRKLFMEQKKSSKLSQSSINKFGFPTLKCYKNYI